ncbi:MAG: acyl transferase [Bacteroidetes bacterium]|nr:acyl transferase [Bacteroidota bacterium]MBX7238531.1 acyl transferase [Bacteroidia bacterium]MCC7513838.1 acyl transferase [Bacteroidia bacterium]MCW5919985.1 acyl transferase [Bacteroidota bacterium]HCI58241.1 acyl transferase [Bacteroidota bacterium]
MYSALTSVFDTPFDFESVALESFRFQAENNAVYHNYLKLLNINPLKIDSISKIPFLPISFFKTKKVVTGNIDSSAIVFSSSRTTGTEPSLHYVSDISLYEKAFTQAFNHFYTSTDQWCILALLPSYLEREGSSLVYMCQHLVEKTGKKNSGFYLNDFRKLADTITVNEQRGIKTLLIGVSFALLDFAHAYPMPLKNTVIMETGGMKGRRKEMIRQELHAILKEAFLLNVIHSEYGMTELLSQAYSSGNGIFHCPPWMKVFVRDSNDPLSESIPGQGGINIIDLANINSCCFISTQDIGRVYDDGTFEILGRFENAEVRGCNLLIE